MLNKKHSNRLTRTDGLGDPEALIQLGMGRSGREVEISAAALGLRPTDRAICEPTTHRGPRSVCLPPPHYPHECRPESTPSAPTGGSSSQHSPWGASPRTDGRGPRSGTASLLYPAICAVPRGGTGADWPTHSSGGMGERAPQSREHQSPPPATSTMRGRPEATKGLRCTVGKRSTMRCRSAAKPDWEKKRGKERGSGSFFSP